LSIVIFLSSFQAIVEHIPHLDQLRLRSGGSVGSISSMLKPLQQGLMAIHLALEELALPHRIAAFEGNALLKDFGGTSPVPRALIAGLQGTTCSQVMPTLEPTFDALMARPEEIKVLLLLHDGLAHDPDELAS
jgi:hypothetical protein